MKNLFLTLSCLILSLTSSAQQTEIFKRTGNPIFTDKFTADPAGLVDGGWYY